MKDKPNYITLTDENFEKEVLESKQPVLVEFGADWCGPCAIMAPIIEDLAVHYQGHFRIGQLDVDGHGKVAEEYGIRALPTFLFFKHGRVLDHIAGAVSKKELTERLLLCLF